MARQISTVVDTLKFTFRPEFPDAMVDRYPSLTRALGNNYPGLQSHTINDADNRTGPNQRSDSEPLPIARPTTTNFQIPIPADGISELEISSDNSFWGINSFPRWQDLDMPTHAPSTPELASGNNFFDSNSIPICNGRMMGLLDATSDAQNLRLPSVRSSYTPPCAPSSDEQAEHRKDTVHPSRTHQKSYELCDRRTHEKMHASKQGVQSNLQRHQVSHGIRRTGRSRPIAPYEIKFEPHLPGPPLLSDTTSMPTAILWDREGPFTRRPID
ncbi:hypothetical protein B0H13DRAFT_1873516 [Mycena leptocephala]|nr:hypothetical protein B0H13DRAFT_1873516 [Mycena leptocephala]